MEYTSILDSVFGSFVFIYLFTIIVQFLIVFSIIKGILQAIKSVRRKSSHNYFKNNVVVTSFDFNKDKYTDISKEELSTFNTDDLETFKNFFYKIFIDFENAYNNLDYNTMKALSTKQLFQNYYTGITLDLEAGNKKIINNIQKQKVIIYETFSSTAKQVVSAMIEVSYINYTMNKKGIVIKGNKDRKVTEKFEVTFRKDFGNDDITNCPNCGANITGSKCEFCRTTVKNVSFKISSIKRIVDSK